MCVRHQRYLMQRPEILCYLWIFEKICYSCESNIFIECKTKQRQLEICLYFVFKLMAIANEPASEILYGDSS
jgi:hypothetical protein